MEINVNGVSITLTKEQLKEIAKQTQKPEKWQDRLIIKNRHWYLASAGINSVCSKYYNSTSNNKPESIFENKEHAELLAKKCNLMIEMHNFAYAMNEGWLPDWDSERMDIKRFGLSPSDHNRFYVDDFGVYPFVFGIAVKSKEIAEQMLAEFGDRIKEVYNTQY